MELILSRKQGAFGRGKWSCETVRTSGLKGDDKKTPKQLKEQFQGLLVSSAESEEKKTFASLCLMLCIYEDATATLEIRIFESDPHDKASKHNANNCKLMHPAFYFLKKNK